ncbi:MAG: reverse transcriptase domain-containing protein, partial [Aquabacterium sp.]|uniref:DDE-type integrase/transposase/recombinase n=1 Tax=Aquabacterium sp. TaxID=1872578 RepID=UPI002715F326
MTTSTAPIESSSSLNAISTVLTNKDDNGTLTPAERLHLTLGHASANAIRRLIKNGSLEGLPSKTPHGLDKVGGVNCKGCSLGKSTRVRTAPVIPEAYQPSKPLERLDMDLIGPIKTGLKLAVNSYILVIVDCYTRYTWVYLLQRKSDASEWIKYHIAMLERTYPNYVIKTLKSDGGGEFINQELYDYTMAKGINVVLSPPHTSHRNSIVERKNYHLLNVSRSLLVSAGLPPIFWEYAVTYAVLIVNRLVRRNGPGTSPYEMIHGTKPKLKHLKVFGSDAIVYLRKQERDNKMSSTAMRCIYVGWYSAYQTHLIYSPETSNILGTHHVRVINGKFTTPVNIKVKGYNNSNYDKLIGKDVVIEGHYDFKLLSNTIPAIRLTDTSEREAEQSSSVVTGIIHNDLINYGEVGTTGLFNTKDIGTTTSIDDSIQVNDLPTRGVDTQSEATPPADVNTNGSNQTYGSIPTQNVERSNKVLLPRGIVQQRSLTRTPAISTPSTAINTPTIEPNPQIRRVLPPRAVKFKQTYTALTLVSKEKEAGTDKVATRIACNNFAVHKQVVHHALKQLSIYANSKNSRETYAINSTTTNASTGTEIKTSTPASVSTPTVIKKVYEPRTIKEAQRLPEWDQWKAAAAKEIDSQVNNGVWVLVPASSVPVGQRPIKSRWIFKVKYNADSTIEKFKARVVLKGFEQKYGTDYINTYAPTLHLK